MGQDSPRAVWPILPSVTATPIFAAQYLVACQWDPKEMQVLKDKPLWITVCEGDNKAYPQ